MTALVQPIQINGKRSFSILQLVVHILALIPVALLIWDAAHANLTANPIQEATYRTGQTALVLLVASLAVTPVSSISGVSPLVKLRRPLGVYGFLYAAVHVFIFAILDYGMDLDLIRDTIMEKRYVLAGIASFVLLLPLALTSTKGWMKRLGKRWKKLHYLAYVAIPLGVIHYIWLIKADVRVPAQYAFIVTVLIVLRIPIVRHYFSGFRLRLSKRFR